MTYTVSKLTDYSANALLKAFGEAKLAFRDELQGANTPAEWKAVRDRWMARKNGLLTQINDQLKAAPKEAKREIGQYLNDLREFIEKEIENWQVLEEGAVGELAPLFQSIDITLPGIRRPIGAEHPVIKTTNEMVRVFQKLGYSVADAGAVCSRSPERVHNHTAGVAAGSIIAAIIEIHEAAKSTNEPSLVATPMSITAHLEPR